MDQQRKELILQYIQPGLLGLMDGAVSTIAPIFAAAYATHSTWVAFLVGMSASVGAGISMGFAEALSDTGVHTGRGHPFRRGFVAGLMTFIGGVIHTVPFAAPDFSFALYVAYFVVGLELIVISYVRHHFFQMSFWKSMVQVVAGSVLVLIAGILIGSA